MNFCILPGLHCSSVLHRSDLSFYDGLKESIITMALVPVRPNVFRASIQYLLCVSTVSSIVILGFITSPETKSSENPGNLSEGFESFALLRKSKVY